MLQVITAMLLANCSPKGIPAQDLAPMIIWLSSQRSVNVELVTKIVIIESKCEQGARNKKTSDYGLMQLNYHTMRSYGISVTCAMNWKCNLEAGIKILSDMADNKGYRACMYNLGPRGRFKKYASSCQKYERKLASIN